MFRKFSVVAGSNGLVGLDLLLVYVWPSNPASLRATKRIGTKQDVCPQENSHEEKKIKWKPEVGRLRAANRYIYLRCAKSPAFAPQKL